MRFKNLSNTEFYERIINSLPGIFYLYELINDEIYLKLWNKNHAEYLEYDHDELYNKIRMDFLPDDEYEKVSNAIEKVFNEGTAQVVSNLLTKSGKQIPFLLEAYSFSDDDRKYLIGFGLDYRNRIKLESDYNKSKNKQEELKEANSEILNLIEAKKRELVTAALEKSKTNNTIKIAINGIDKLMEKYRDQGLANDLNKIKCQLEIEEKKQEDWEIFKLRFKQVHPNFFKGLLERHPNLSNTEVKFCAYLYIGISSSQQASILNVSTEAIKKTRYRIRKKINLKTGQSLDQYILSF